MKRYTTALLLALVLAACGGGNNQSGGPASSAGGGGGGEPSVTPGLQPSIPMESESAPPEDSPSASAS